MTKTVFDQKIVKKCLGFFLFNFAFKQPKEQILFRMQPLKIMKKHIILYSFLGKIQNFQKPYAKWIANMQFWNWGRTTIWHNKQSVTFYFPKSLHPTVQYCVR